MKRVVKKTIGAFILTILFGGIFYAVAYVYSVKESLLLFAAATIIVAAIALAVKLLMSK